MTNQIKGQMTSKTTLLGFLEAKGFKARFYDLGRRIQKISRKDFEKFEQQQIAYPFPLQQQAWFAVSLALQQNSPEDTELEPVIWFLRFPLDETGRLILASRDYFLHRLLEASLAENSEQHVSEAALKDNPHVFKPRDDKMAIFHAILTYSFKTPASRFYSHAKNYFSGAQGWDQWSFVGFQGIADLAVRFREDHNAQLIADAIPQIAVQPLEALCQCLENLAIPLNIASALQLRLDQELALPAPDNSIVSFLCRAVSLSESATTIDSLFQKVLSSQAANSPEVLSAFSARCWSWLSEQANAKLYLNALADADQEIFNACIADLLYLPGMRDSLLSVIRDPQRPDKLAEKFGQFMQGFKRP